MTTRLTFPILGRRFVAEHIDQELAEWLQRCWDFPEYAPPEHPYSVRVLRASQPPLDTGERWTPAPVVLPDRALHFRQQDQCWVTGDSTAGLRLSIGEREARIDAWGTERWPDRATVYHSLQVMITEAVRHSGLLPLHAAVAAQNGLATAWLGASGMGKSTTLLYATSAGWRPIAEDLCWLDPARLEVYGWDRAVRVWPDTLRRFFPALTPSSQPDLEGKLSIPYIDIGGGRRSARLARIALLSREPQVDSGTEPLEASDAVRAIWEATGVPLSTVEREQSAEWIGRLIRTVCCERLILGRTSPVI